MLLFSFWLFIRAVLSNKFIELGYSCPKFRAWQTCPLCFRVYALKNAKNGGDGQHIEIMWLKPFICSVAG